MKSKAETCALILSLTFAIASIITYVIGASVMVALPTFLTLTVFFFVVAMMLELDFSDDDENEIVFDDYYKHFPYGKCNYNFQCGGAYVCSITCKLCNSNIKEMRCEKFERRQK